MNNEHVAGGSSVYEVINQYQAFKDDNDVNARDRRFDVTLLINGIPLIHIELKNKEHSYMDGYRQIKKYIAEGKFHGIFSNVQMFVVSNAVDTKYFSAARDTELNKKFLTGWIDRENMPVCDYIDFAEVVLRIPQAHEMVTKYTVLDNDKKKLLILRPYQIHAIEAMREASKAGKSGYIWHTTGSGKTMTSYKATRNLLMDIPSIQKTVFLIDRKDLDLQTKGAFQSYADNDTIDVDDTEHVGSLIKKLADDNRQMIVTTRQKMQVMINRRLKEGTKEYRVLKENLKDAASKEKMEWVYVNRLTLCIITFFVSVFLFAQLHKVEINYIYTDPTTEFDLVGSMNDKQKRKAMEITESDNQYLDFYRGNTEVQQKDIEKIMKNGRINKDYVEATNEEVATAAKRVLDKLHTVNKENLQWFEVLFAMVFAMAAYMAPVWLLKFQAKMRQIEMEDEVMQFQTIILMLMRIERVNVEIILEWLERYANIFREPISKCVNNFESGAWEALEQLKEDVNYPDMIRLIESMQAAVEKIPIADAFDELDTERDYYQARRKESNERLISKKGLIGKVIGFTPMIGLFVCYLVVPLVVIGLSAMKDSFNAMSAMK